MINTISKDSSDIMILGRNNFDINDFIEGGLFERKNKDNPELIYKKNKKFHCYTDCGDNFNIFELFKRRYELLGKEYNFYKDIVLVIADGQEIDGFEDDFTKKYVSDFDKYNNKFNKIVIDEISENLLNTFTFSPTLEWLNDGISIEAMKDYNILYSINTNKIIRPAYKSVMEELE